MVDDRKKDRKFAKYEMMHAVQTLNTDDESITCIQVSLSDPTRDMPS